MRIRPTIGATVVLLAVTGPSSAVDLGDGLIHLRAGQYSVGEGPAAMPAPRSAPAPDREARAPDAVETFLVVVAGPIEESVRESLEREGRRIVGYVPSNAYLVRGPGESVQRLAEDPAIARVDAYRWHWKIEPELDLDGIGLLLHVDVFAGEDPRRVAGEIEAIGAIVASVHDFPVVGVRRLVVRADGALVPEIAGLSAVEWVEERGTLTLRNDAARWVIQSNQTDETPLYDRGLFGEGQIAGHVDGSIDTSSCFFRDPDHAPGPDHRKLVAWRFAGGLLAETHGTHTAGTLAGENLDLDFPEHRGMAPKARVSHSDWNQLNGDEWNGQPSNLAQLFQLAHDDGAHVHSNSWGDDGRTTYTTWCRDIDSFSRSYENDLVLFAVTNGTLLKSPENAKNCLAVGATKRAPLQHLHDQGGQGPTSDGRRKPEVYVPGQSTRSAVPAACATGTLSGTSMACPAVAGGALLIREYFERGYFPTGVSWEANALVPTGALVKAVLLNSTVDLTGVPGYPSNLEGWGRILLDDALYFAGDDRGLWFRDVRHAEGLSGGEVREWSFQVEGSDQPLAVTLAFMDVPASVGAALAPVNDLDLEIEGPDGTFLGNVFDTVAGQSVIGGAADPLNNVERVLLPAPALGRWTVRVSAATVPAGPQGFAVVVNGNLTTRRMRTGEAPDRPGEPGREVVTGPTTRLDPFRPNPFRSTTDVTFALSQRGRVHLQVFDLQGRLVRVLLDRQVSAGEYRIPWDGRDEAGAAVSPGVYFARLTAPGFTRTVKGVRLR